MKRRLYRVCAAVAFIGGNSAFSMQQSFPSNSFHYLVTAPVLDNQLLVENNRGHYFVNDHDNNGITPMHYLVARKDSTIEQVNALIERGADPTIRTSIRKNQDGILAKGHDPYKTAIKYNGRSPVKTPITSFFEHQCYGNKEVVRYIFDLILMRKLEEAVLKEEKKRAQEAQKRSDRKELREKLEEQQKELEQRQEVWKSAKVWRENTSEVVVDAK